MAIPMLKIRRPLGRLIFNMGIATPGKTVFLIETAPSCMRLGWDFVNTVTKSQISITAFYDIMNDKYNLSSAEFMSRNTFTNWIFSWLSKFKFDFRNPCMDCQFTPQVLAFDTTKLGIFSRNVSVSPIETPTLSDTAVS